MAQDAFEALPLIEGCTAVIAAHPSGEEIYPRLRAAGIPLVGAFAARQERPYKLAQKIGADGYVLRPYKRESLGIALYAATSARLLRDRATRAEMALAEVVGQEASQSGLLHADLFKTLLPLEIRRARRHGYPIAICVVAIDPLPGMRASFPELAAACEPMVREAVRDVDLAARYGNGRFLLFLPHTNAHGAETVGRRILEGVKNTQLSSASGPISPTVSVGIATPRAGANVSFARLIKDAHAALKAAQLKGGDRVILRS